MPITYKHVHPWEVSPQDAARIQTHLRAYWVSEPLGVLNLVGGVDVSFPKGKGIARAAVVVMAYPGLNLIETVVAEEPLSFPYIPGLLSFREAPVILKVLGQLRTNPDALLFDGHGIAHPRRFGLASHLGVVLDLPTIGCAKSVLVGTYEDPGEEVGSISNLLDDGEVIGSVVRTRSGVKPVFVSIGHRADLPSAITLVLACGQGYRLPEPTRLADRLAASPPQNLPDRQPPENG